MQVTKILGVASLLAVVGCADRTMPSESFGLDCVFDFRTGGSECAGVRERQVVQEPALTEARELVIDRVTAERRGTSLVVDVQLAGAFANGPDQNVYVFLGARTRDGAPVTYALSADPSYASDLAYPVRSSVLLPHANDIRVAVMEPEVSSFTPQVYVGDPVRAEAVGASAGIGLRVDGRAAHVEIPLDRYYARKKLAVPDQLGVTVATARDYVGFVDQVSIVDLAAAGARTETTRATAPMAYPMLDPRSHRFERVALHAMPGGGVSVEIETAAPIVDWAQTNLHFYFVPVAPYATSRPLRDASKTRTLPYKWSSYGAVYSPHRVFWKASQGKDFTFDDAYAERVELPMPDGVVFRERAPGRYALELSPRRVEEARAGRPTFAVVVAAGRDGFGPTSWFGVSEVAAGTHR